MEVEMKRETHTMPDGTVMSGKTHNKKSKQRPKKVLYKPVKSSNVKKKYMVYVKGPNGNPRLIHFGARGMAQYKDKIGVYSAMDHGDAKRKANYYSRHGKATSKDSAKYWSHKILW